MKKAHSAAFDLTRGKELAPIRPINDRGRLWYDFQIPERFLGGLPGITNPVRWVREHLPRGKRVKIGIQSAWYEADILEWLASLQLEGEVPSR